MNPIELILSRLPDARRNGKGWLAKCPAHEDRKPSLSIATGDDGTVLLRCHAGCSADAICAAVGVEMRDLFPPKPDTTRGRKTQSRATRPKPKGRSYATRDDAIRVAAKMVGGRAVAGWPYQNADSQVVLWVVRFETRTGKGYRPIHPDGDGWRIGDPPGQLPLYRLPELTKASRVYVIEGEKAADAARSIGLTATTSAHGSQATARTDWMPLAGREVVILPDNDQPGGKYAQVVAASLGKLHPKPAVKVVVLPGLPEHGDFVEYLEARNGQTKETIRAELEALVAHAPILTPLEPVRGRPALPPPFVPFPVNALPYPVGRFVRTSAKAIGCDPSYIALPVLSGLAAAVGNTRRIELKKSWTEPAVIWTAPVGESGTLKSPAQDPVLRPIREKQAAAFKAHAEAMARYETDLVEYEREMAQWKKSKTHGDPPEKPERPICERYLCSDTTVEALADRLSNAPRGMLLARDELAGWVNSFDQYKGGRGGDVAHWLAMHGARDLLVDRRTGDKATIYVRHAAVSITGGIQPKALRRALAREHFESGLAARLLVAMPPSKRKQWTEADIGADLQTEFADLFARLWELQPDRDDAGEPRPRIVRLTPEAKREWITFYNDHAREQADLTGDLAAAWSKLEGYAARLALVIHLARWAAYDPTVNDADYLDAQSIVAGVTLSRWFGHEARRVYTVLGESDEDREQRRLIELIERKGGRITPRELRQSDRRFRDSTEAAENALEDMVTAGFGRWEDVAQDAKGGRPARVFVLSAPSTVYETPCTPEESEGFVDVDNVNVPAENRDEVGEWTA